MYGAPFGKRTIRSVNHVFWVYLNHSLSDIYTENILGYLHIAQIVFLVEPKYTRNISQTKFFFLKRRATRGLKKRFCDSCFQSLFRL